MRPHLAGLALLPVCLLAVCLLARAPNAQSFQDGDIYLVSNALPVPFAPYEAGVVRIDPITGATQRLITIDFFIFNAISAFDPYRDGILVPGRLAAMPVNTTLILVHANGTATVALTSTNRVSALAPVGDGRVYLLSENLNLQCLDAQDTLHDVLDAAGSQVIALPSTNALFYDGGTNAVFALSLDTASCGFPNNVITQVQKIPLLPGGLQAASATVSAQVCMTSPPPTTAFGPNHFSRGPGGSIFFSVDDNSNGALTRTFLVDPVTLAITPFATNGPYTGAATTTAAVYSSRLGDALLVDGFNEVLRRYALGESGLGTIFATGTGAHTSANTLLEISSLGCQPNLGFQGPGTVTASLCGSGLDLGESCDYEILGAEANAPGAFLIATPNLANVTLFPLANPGVLVSGAGLAGAFPITADGSGHLSFTVPGLSTVADLVFQSLFVDSTVLPHNVAFTNAVLARFGQ